jgi:hypothetical protein
VLFGLAILAACGGASKKISDTPQNPGPGDVSSTAPVGSSAPAPNAPDAGPPTTTDALDADAGAGQKLASKDDGGTGGAKGGAAPGRSVKDIQAIILAKRELARKCYDDALKNHPGIEGSLVIQWTIDPKGNVSKISVDQSRSAISEPSVAACIIEIIKPIKFAEHPQGKETETYYPFDFHPHTYGKH